METIRQAEAALLEAEEALSRVAAHRHWPDLVERRPELREALRWTREGVARAARNLGAGWGQAEQARQWVEEAFDLAGYIVWELLVVAEAVSPEPTQGEAGRASRRPARPRRARGSSRTA